MSFNCFAGLASIFGFILSFLTVIQTIRIDKKLNKQKYEIKFRSMGHSLLSSFNTYIEQLTSKDINNVVLIDIRKNTNILYSFATNCKWSKEKTIIINEFLTLLNTYIKEFSNGNDCESIYGEILLKITDVHFILFEEVNLL